MMVATQASPVHHVVSSPALLAHTSTDPRGHPSEVASRTDTASSFAATSSSFGSTAFNTSGTSSASEERNLFGDDCSSDGRVNELSSATNRTAANDPKDASPSSASTSAQHRSSASVDSAEDHDDSSLSAPRNERLLVTQQSQYAQPGHAAQSVRQFAPQQFSYLLPPHVQQPHMQVITSHPNGVYYPSAEQQQPAPHTQQARSTTAPSRPLLQQQSAPPAQPHESERHTSRSTSPVYTAVSSPALLSAEHVISKQYQIISSLHTMLEGKDQLCRETQSLLEHERANNEGLVLSLQQAQHMVSKLEDELSRERSDANIITTQLRAECNLLREQMNNSERRGAEKLQAEQDDRPALTQQSFPTTDIVQSPSQPQEEAISSAPEYESAETTANLAHPSLATTVVAGNSSSNTSRQPRDLPEEDAETNSINPDQANIRAQQETPKSHTHTDQNQNQNQNQSLALQQVQDEVAERENDVSTIPISPSTASTAVSATSTSPANTTASSQPVRGSGSGHQKRTSWADQTLGTLAEEIANRPSSKKHSGNNNSGGSGRGRRSGSKASAAHPSKNSSKGAQQPIAPHSSAQEHHHEQSSTQHHGGHINSDHNSKSNNSRNHGSKSRGGKSRGSGGGGGGGSGSTVTSSASSESAATQRKNKNSRAAAQAQHKPQNEQQRSASRGKQPSSEQAQVPHKPTASQDSPTGTGATKSRSRSGRKNHKRNANQLTTPPAQSTSSSSRK